MTNDKGLSLTPIDGRTVRLHEPTIYREDVEGNEIVRLYRDSGSLEIKIGESVSYKNTKHRVNIITHAKRGKTVAAYDLKSSLLTASSTFALPFLGGNRKYMLWDSLFVNAFISTEEYDECIALLYRFSGDTLFTKFEAAMCAMPTFIKFVDVDKYHVLFIFDVPTSARKSYERFRNGQYSEIDDIWKLIILDYHGYDSNGKTGQILFKSPELKEELEKKLETTLSDDAELHSIPDMKYERFNIDYYRT